MDKEVSVKLINPENAIPKTSWGGARTNSGGKREGSGRKDGSESILTIGKLLKKMRDIDSGQSYEDKLIEDFNNARNSNDRHLIYKYHQLILGKVMNTLNRVEITDSGDLLKAKEEAFSQALQRLITKQAE